MNARLQNIKLRRGTMGKRLWKALAVLAAVCLVLAFGSADVKTVEAAGKTVSITACQINPDLTTVTVIGSTTQIPANDDGMMYLFAEPTYSGGITTAAAASQPAAGTVTFTAELLQGQAESRLYSKFVIAVKQGGVFVPVSNFCYITNPQAIATHTVPRIEVTSKKGLNPDPARLHELADLGVQHINYNIPMADLLGPSTNPVYPTITYVYNGKAYAFNGAKISEYDAIFSYVTQQNISVTAVLLNNWRTGYEYMLHPLSRDGTVTAYYMPNAAEQVGVEYLAAISSFLASRYNNPVYGQVDNWILGNEVPARTQWNYIQSMSLASYVEEYAKGLRVVYTAIKSENAQARVYTSTDNYWAWTRNFAHCYRSKDFLTELNNNISAQGNFSWGVSAHPYPVPLTYSAWWTGGQGAYYVKLINHTANSPYVSMENLEVFTDFMCQPQMLTPAGQVRPIIINEIGYSSVQGEANQAAAFVWGYLQAEANQHIDAFILNSQSDHPAEVAQGMRLGLEDVNGVHKPIYDYFKYIDTPNAAQYKAAARQTIGRFSAWDQVIIPR